MELKFVVNRASHHPRPVDVEFKGEIARMVMSEREVEFYDPTGTHGTMTLHFSGTSELAASEKFVGGAAVTVDLDAFVVTPPAVEVEQTEEPAAAAA